MLKKFFQEVKPLRVPAFIGAVSLATGFIGPVATDILGKEVKNAQVDRAKLDTQGHAEALINQAYTKCHAESKKGELDFKTHEIVFKIPSCLLSQTYNTVDQPKFTQLNGDAEVHIPVNDKYLSVQATAAYNTEVTAANAKVEGLQKDFAIAQNVTGATKTLGGLGIVGAIAIVGGAVLSSRRQRQMALEA